MKRKVITLFVFPILFIMLDITFSPLLKIFFSFAYISYIISTFDQPYVFYFPVIFGVMFDTVFSPYIGPYTLLFFLISLMSYLICSFYNIKKLFLQLLLVPFCFIPFILINKNINETFYSVFFTEAITLAIYPLLNHINKGVSYEKTQ